jgi:hypothetical protein
MTSHSKFGSEINLNKPAMNRIGRLEQLHDHQQGRSVCDMHLQTLETSSKHLL